MQLKVKDILEEIEELKQNGMSQEEIENLDVYIGDDEVLNGIHTALFCVKIDESERGLVELVEECVGIEFTGTAILIS